MGVSKQTIDDLKDLQEKMEGLFGGKNDEFLEYAAKQIAARLLSYVIPDTPVITGRLRRGWVGQDTGGASPNIKDIESYVETQLPIKKKSNQVEVTISNRVEYAPYVEYGHRTQPSVKVNNTESATGWVEGQFMLRRAVNSVKQSYHGILDKLLEEYFVEYFRR